MPENNKNNAIFLVGDMKRTLISEISKCNHELLVEYSDEYVKEKLDKFHEDMSNKKVYDDLFGTKDINFNITKNYINTPKEFYKYVNKVAKKKRRGKR